MEMDVPFEVVVRGIAAFAGVERRFTVRGEAGAAIVVDDYGHHPVEIQATSKSRHLLKLLTPLLCMHARSHACMHACMLR